MSLQKVKTWLWYSYAGAVILGSAVGLLFGITLFCILSATGASAGQVKTLTLSESYVEGDTRICVYSDAQRVETVQVDAHTKCKHVLTVDADE